MIYFFKIVKIIEKKFYKKINSGFWSNFESEDKIEDLKIVIDLSNEKINHFGDNLFFISAFINKDLKNFQFLISDKYHFLWKKFNIDNVINKLEFESEKTVYISSFETAKLNFKTSKKFKKKILFDFTDSTIHYPLYKHISDFFKLRKISNHHTLIPISDEIANNEHFNKIIKKKFFIYNDIMYSRTFLRNKLSLQLKKHIESTIGYNNPIYFIGSEYDKKFQNNNEKLVDIRGKIDFDHMISLMLNDNCLGFIGLDNGLMHLSLFFNKKVKIIFRGKFSKSQSDHHYRCINISMNKKAKNNIEYINTK